MSLLVYRARSGFGASGQLDVWAKSPEAEIVVIVSGDAEVFLRLTFFAVLVVVGTWLPNVRLAGDKVTGKIPVPLNEATWGEFEALSLTLTVPVRLPETVGVKVTEIVQLPPATSVFGVSGHVEVWAKSPETAILVMVTGTVWLLWRVRVLAALVVFTNWLPNARLAGDKVTGKTPLPLSAAICGLFDALSLTVNVPLSAPVTNGVNVTEIVQLARAPKVFGEMGQFEFGDAKSPEIVIAEMVSATAW
jgi:hypothetical protein